MAAAASGKLLRLGRGLWLSPPRAGDLPELVRWLRDPQIAAWTLRIPFPYAEADGRQFLRDAARRAGAARRPMDWAIRARGRLIGVIGLQGRAGRSTRRDEVGFWLAKPFRRRGIMTLALRRITALGLGAHALRRIDAMIFASNAASCRLVERCGYRLERFIPAAYEKDGRRVDVKRYVVRSWGSGSSTRQDPAAHRTEAAHDARAPVADGAGAASGRPAAARSRRKHGGHARWQARSSRSRTATTRSPRT